MLHRSCDRAVVRENHSYNNGDAGMALYESFECKVYNNLFEYNKRESWERKLNLHRAATRLSSPDPNNSFRVIRFFPRQAGVAEPFPPNTTHLFFIPDYLLELYWKLWSH